MEKQHDPDVNIGDTQLVSRAMTTSFTNSLHAVLQWARQNILAFNPGFAELSRQTAQYGMATPMTSFGTQHAMAQ